MLVSLFDDGLLDGVTGVFCDVFIYYLFSVALAINFFSRILFLYCSYKISRFTHSVKIFISDCLSSSSVRQKHQYMASLRFMHPQTPQTSASLDDLIWLKLVYAPTIPRTVARSDELFWSGLCTHKPRRHQHIWSSHIDLAGYSCLK